MTTDMMIKAPADNNIKLLDKKDINYEYTRSLTGNTRRTYVAAIKEFFRVDDLSEITVEMMQSVTPYIANDWAERMLKKGNTKATANKKLGALRSFYKFLCRRTVGVMTYNPFDTDEGCVRFKNAVKTYSDRRALTPEETMTLLNAVKRPKSRAGEEYLLYLRDKLVLQLLVVTGMRREEIATLRIGDITLNSGKHVVRIIGKGDKFRLAVVPEAVMESVKEYLKARHLSMSDVWCPLITSHANNAEPNSFVNDITIYRIVKKYAMAAGIHGEDISPHNLRHTFATNSLQMGARLEDVQDMMGHSNLNTTRRYDHVHRTIQNSTGERLSDLYGIM